MNARTGYVVVAVVSTVVGCVPLSLSLLHKGFAWWWVPGVSLLSALMAYMLVDFKKTVSAVAVTISALRLTSLKFAGYTVVIAENEKLILSFLKSLLGLPISWKRIGKIFFIGFLASVILFLIEVSSLLTDLQVNTWVGPSLWVSSWIYVVALVVTVIYVITEKHWKLGDFVDMFIMLTIAAIPGVPLLAVIFFLLIIAVCIVVILYLGLVTLFIMIHSKRRRACAVDTFFGVMIGSLIGLWFESPIWLVIGGGTSAFILGYISSGLIQNRTYVRWIKNLDAPL